MATIDKKLIIRLSTEYGHSVVGGIIAFCLILTLAFSAFFSLYNFWDYDCGILESIAGGCRGYLDYFFYFAKLYGIFFIKTCITLLLVHFIIQMNGENKKFVDGLISAAVIVMMVMAALASLYGFGLLSQGVFEGAPWFPMFAIFVTFVGAIGTNALMRGK